MPVRKLTALALYTTLSLTVYAVESMIPPLIPIPGIKLGLANIITLVVLRRYSPGDACLVLTARILLSSLLFGQAVSLLYSLAAMYLTGRLLGRKMSFLTGAMGGLTHNLGQLLTALVLTATPGVLAYLPFLALSGILTGLFTGLAAAFSERLLPSHMRH